jgi:predicted ATPase
MVSYNEYSQLSRIKYYKFKRIEEFQPRQSTALEPPNGDNLFFSIYGNARCRELVTDIVKSAGYEIVFRPQQKAFEFQKRTGNTIVAYPYVLLSDTFQRVIFYSVAIETNKNAILAFEEPESHAFPYYTKFLGEKIARDEDNQYFIATHNPYLLNAIIAKGKQDSINIFKTTFKDYQTRVELLSKEKVAGLSDIDPFIAIGDI